MMHHVTKYSLQIVLILALGAPSLVWGRPMSATDAETVAAGWLTTGHSPLGTALGSQVTQTESHYDIDGQILFHVVYLAPSGFVLVAPDDLVEPILAFSEGGTFETSPENPLFTLAEKDLRGRLRTVTARRTSTAATSDLDPAAGKWAQLTARASGRNLQGIASVDDPRVSPFIASRWNQSGSAGGACYNYFTPPYPTGTSTNYPCGCVATAYAQLMRYFLYPTVALGTGSYQIRIDGVYVMRTLRGGDGAGGPHNWTNMPLVPSGGLTTAQREAIGSICYDIGLAVGMQYTASGSSAYMPPTTLTNLFRFGNAVEGDGDHWDLMSMINPNLDARLPVPLSVQRPGGGHLVLCDGYGYNLSTLYHHINLGWGGSYDAWYALPDIDAGPYHYVTIDRATYNIYTNGRGEILSGRTLDASGRPLTNTLVRIEGGGLTNVVPSGSNGVYAFTRLTSHTDYRITATNGSLRFPERSVHVNASIEDGDCGNRWGINLPAVAGGDYVIAGQILRAGTLGVAGVTVSPAGMNCVTTDLGGYYAFAVPAGWSGAVGYSRTRFHLAEATRSYSNVSSNLFEENLSAQYLVYVDADAAGANDGSSWSDAFTFLPDAVSNALPGTAVLVAEGLYLPGTNRWIYFALPAYVELYGGFSGAETNLAERNPTLHPTILSGDIGLPGIATDNCYHVVQGAEGARLDSLTVCGGYANGGGSGQYGGGIYNYGVSNMTIAQCVITGNYAMTYGGGVYYGNVFNSRIAGNQADNYGGGLYYGNVFASRIENNQANSYGGGAYRSYLESCLVISNTASYGGGSFRSTNVNCTLVLNTASNFGGGAYEGVLANSIVVSNRAPTGANHYNSEASYTCTTPLPAGTGNLNADPRFINTTQGNYRLQASSPCINTGNNARVSWDVDIDSQPRIWAGRVDLGAYETITYTLTATAGPHGAISPGGAVTVLAHSDQAFTLNPTSYYQVAEILQDGVSRNPTNNPFVWTNVTADGILQSSFTERLTTNNHTPHWWLASYGLTNFETEAGADADHDGISSGEEYAADTCPTNADSCLRVNGMNLLGTAWLQWIGGSSVTQYVERSEALQDSWQVVATNRPPTTITNALSLPSDSTGGFYRIRTVR